MPTITRAGGETLVNTTTRESQATPVVTQLGGGRYVIVWVDNYSTAGGTFPVVAANTDIRGQVYNTDGTRSGSEFVINTVTAGAQIRPVVTTLSDGNFLVGWQNGVGIAFGAGNDASFQAQEFTNTGTAVGAQFQVAANEAISPQFSQLAGGGFVAVWQAGISGNVRAQIFDANNAPIGSTITIDSTQLAPVALPQVTTLANGNFVVAWQNGTGAASGVSMQIYSAVGGLIGSEIGVGPNSGSFTSSVASIAALTSGGFALAWNQTWNSAPGSWTLNLDYYLPDGTFGMNNVLANMTNGGGSTQADIAPLANGGALVTWTELNSANGDGSGLSVRGAAFSPIGNQIGTTFLVNTTTAGDQVSPGVALLSTGDLVIAWSDASAGGGDASGTAIRSQRYLYNPANNAPVAVNDVVVLNVQGGTPYSFSPDNLTDNDSDADGDPLVVSAVANASGGTVSVAQNGDIFVTPTAGNSGPISFNYTTSDGAGGAAQAAGTLYLLVDDNVVVRGATRINIDMTANDNLPASGNSFSAVSPGTFQPVLLSSGVPLVAYSPAIDNGVLNLNSSYFNQLVGTNTSTYILYILSNTAAFGANQYSAYINVTIQGWAQIGGTSFDSLVGTSSADSLQGGSGAANELQGGLGDDWYTVAAVGDSIIENADAGLDSVRTALSSLTLAANVEHLYYTGTSGFVGAGNASHNYIQGGFFADTLAGLEGNDILDGRSTSQGQEDTLIGGTGDDVYIVGVRGSSVVEYAGEGMDEVRSTAGVFYLPDHVERLTYIGSTGFVGVGNAQDNVILGGTTRDVLIGDAGNDTISGGSGAANEVVGGTGNDIYIARAYDTIIEYAGEGTDEVRTILPSFTLRTNVENLTYTGNASFNGVGSEEANIITGGAAADNLSGLDGDDILIGGSGADLLIGGNGADQFRYNGGESGYDRILDFTSGTDKIALLGTGFTRTAGLAFVSAPGATANSTNSTFLYDTNTGILSYDADGTGSGAAVQLAQLNTGLTLTLGDFIFV